MLDTVPRLLQLLDRLLLLHLLLLLWLRLRRLLHHYVVLWCLSCGIGYLRCTAGTRGSQLILSLLLLLGLQMMDLHLTAVVMMPGYPAAVIFVQILLHATWKMEISRVKFKNKIFVTFRHLLFQLPLTG